MAYDVPSFVFPAATIGLIACTVTDVRVPVPAAFDALAVNVYAVPLVSPVTPACTYVEPLLPVMLPASPALTVVGDCAAPPMYGVTVYDVIAPDPMFAGARKLTVAPASAVIDVTFDGADGGDPGGAPPAVTRLTGWTRNTHSATFT